MTTNIQFLFKNVTKFVAWKEQLPIWTLTRFSSRVNG